MKKERFELNIEKLDMACGGDFNGKAKDNDINSPTYYGKDVEVYDNFWRSSTTTRHIYSAKFQGGHWNYAYIKDWNRPVSSKVWITADDIK